MNQPNKLLLKPALSLTLGSLLAVGLTCVFPKGQTMAQDWEAQIDATPNSSRVEHLRPQADSLLSLGQQAYEQDFIESAIAYWQQAAQVYHQIGDAQALALTYDYLSRSYLSLERYIEAEEVTRRCLAITRDTQNWQGQIYALNNLGMLLLQTQKFDSAAEVFEQASTISHSISDDRGQGLSLNNLGVLAAAEGNYTGAIRYYEEALAMRRQARDLRGEVTTLNNLGGAQQALNQYEQSLYAYRLARKLARIEEDVSKQFIALQGLVTGYTTVNNFSMAINHLAEWLNLARNEGNLRQEFLVLRASSRLQVKEGNQQEAERYYHIAIALAKRLGDSEQAALLTNELSQLIFSP